MMSEELVKKIEAFFSERKGVAVVYLFGSRAKGTDTARSDVDVAVLYEPDCVPDFRDLLETQDILAGRLGQDVNLVALNDANPILKRQVFKYGREVMVRNRALLREVLVRSLTEYDDLKRVRAPIERSLSRRTYHGG